MTAAAAAALRVERLGDGRYRVSGGAELHVVTIDQETARCDCRDYAYRRRQCKHLAIVIQYLILAPLDEVRAVAIGPGLERDVPPPEIAS